jgi:flagella basal body P-ring formation protein FlgA
MKQVPDSLLTFPIPFKALPYASALPRDLAGADGIRYTPFFNLREDASPWVCALPDLSCPLRSIVHFGLGEGRIRSLLHWVCTGLLITLFLFPSLWVVPAFADGNLGSDLKTEPTLRSDVSALLKSYIAKNTSWQDSEIEILSLRNVSQAESPVEDAELRLAPGATLVGRSRLLAPMELVKDGNILRSFWIAADISVHASVLTASRKIAFAKTLAADDVAVTVAEIPDLRATYARFPEELIGKTARRIFAAGDPLIRDLFGDAFLVHRGETVQLRLERNGIALTSLARAEQDGKLGQIISVRNAEFSSAALKAQVTGRAAVSIH